MREIIVCDSCLAGRWYWVKTALLDWLKKVMGFLN